MDKFRTRRPSASMAVAFAALIVALGGTSYAAITLPKNSVGSKQIKKNAVSSTKVKDHSLLSKDFKTGQLPAGPQGPKGSTGATGVGLPGAAGSAKAYASVKDDATFETAPHGFTAVTRPTGSPTGIYCLTPAAGINVVDASPIASPEWYDSSGSDLLVEPLRTVDSCDAGTLEIQTYSLPGGIATLSNNVSFSVLLP